MTEDERLYLQFLQNDIARMNTNSVQTKGWCVAIVSALLAIFADTKNLLFIYISIIPILVFCFLDAFYLQQEHKFVEMYNSFVKGSDDKPSVFEMPVKTVGIGFLSFLRALKSWSVLPVYVLLVLFVLLTHVKYGKSEIKENAKTPQNQERENQNDSQNTVDEKILKSFDIGTSQR